MGALCISAIISTIGYSAEMDDIPESSIKKVAIFVANRAGADLNDQMPIFEDMMIAQVADLGFEVISREMVVDAVGDLLKKSRKNSVDALLDDQTSALRLSQNLGADYLLFASFIGMDMETRTVNSYGVNLKNEFHTLRASYRILDGNTGGALTAGMVSPSRTVQQTKHSQTMAPGLIRELLDKASREIAISLGQKKSQGRIRTVDLEKSQVEFQIAITLNDVHFPEVVLDKNGRAHLTANQVNVQPLAVAVDLDGFTIGTTGSGTALATLPASPGLHRLRLAREDLVTVERMINIYDGMTLNMTMHLTDEGRRKWLENTRLFNSLKLQAELTDAEVERVRGLAQMLRQSGYKVDIKIDTDEGVTIQKNQSLMNQN